jgi:transcriptional regulator with XRE-family HTH domain
MDAMGSAAKRPKESREPQETGDAVTRLEKFITVWGVMPAVFARQAGVSRQHLYQLRKGLAEPTRATMCKLALAASAMRNERVFVTDMFELTESEELTHQMLIVAKVVLATLPEPLKVRS